MAEMSKSEWKGTVVEKRRRLLDGANLYRRMRIRLDDGRVITVRIDRATWRSLNIGDPVSNTADGGVQKT